MSNRTLSRALLFVASSAMLAPVGITAPVVTFLSPPNNSVFSVGTVVTLQGNAGGGGGGLELAFVLDSSGSMGTSETSDGTTQSRRLWQQDIASSIVNSLVPANSSVGVVEFDSNAQVVTPLTPLSSGLASVLAGIAGVDAGGGTNIPSGINAATPMLSGGAPDASKHMIVSSDGFTSGNVVTAATAAAAAGITVHSIALPGADIPTMMSISTTGAGTFVDASNPTTLANLVDLLSQGILVGVDRVDFIAPDGTVHSDIGVNAFGDFSTIPYALQAGNNVFTAIAYGTDQSSATATWNIVGADTAIPEPGTVSLLAGGLAAVALMRRVRKSGQV